MFSEHIGGFVYPHQCQQALAEFLGRWPAQLAQAAPMLSCPTFTRSEMAECLPRAFNSARISPRIFPHLLQAGCKQTTNNRLCRTQTKMRPAIHLTIIPTHLITHPSLTAQNLPLDPPGPMPQDTIPRYRSMSGMPETSSGMGWGTVCRLARRRHRQTRRCRLSPLIGRLRRPVARPGAVMTVAAIHSCDTDTDILQTATGCFWNSSLSDRSL